MTHLDGNIDNRLDQHEKQEDPGPFRSGQVLIPEAHWRSAHYRQLQSFLELTRSQPFVGLDPESLRDMLFLSFPSGPTSLRPLMLNPELNVVPVLDIPDPVTGLRGPTSSNVRCCT